MESTCANDLLSIFMSCRSFYESSEDSVWSRTNQIHARSCHMSIMRAVLDYILHLLIFGHMSLGAIF